MKKLILIAALIIAANMNFSCSNTSKQSNPANEQTTTGKQTTGNDQLPKGVYYTCEMDPEIHSDKPGDCPKCGMKLIRSDSKK